MRRPRLPDLHPLQRWRPRDAQAVRPNTNSAQREVSFSADLATPFCQVLRSLSTRPLRLCEKLRPTSLPRRIRSPQRLFLACPPRGYGYLVTNDPPLALPHPPPPPPLFAEAISDDSALLSQRFSVGQCVVFVMTVPCASAQIPPPLARCLLLCRLRYPPIPRPFFPPALPGFGGYRSVRMPRSRLALFSQKPLRTRENSPPCYPGQTALCLTRTRKSVRRRRRV